MTWQPGKFLPPPSAPVALACPQGSLPGTSCWVGNKQALAPWMLLQAFGTRP